MYWDTDIFPDSLEQLDYEYAREQYRRLWSHNSIQNYMWTLLVILRAFHSRGYCAIVKQVPGKEDEHYIVGRRHEHRLVVRYIHDTPPLFSICPALRNELRALSIEENADNVVLAIRWFFDEQSKTLAKTVGVLLKDGFDLLDLWEATKIPDDPQPTCPKCGALLHLRTTTAPPDGIAWYCTRASAGMCDSSPWFLNEIL